MSLAKVSLPTAASPRISVGIRGSRIVALSISSASRVVFRKVEPSSVLDPIRISPCLLARKRASEAFPIEQRGA